jgi:hypothetical protein
MLDARTISIYIKHIECGLKIVDLHLGELVKVPCF